MKRIFALPPLGLRLKLVLSYLFVTLGAILILAIVVSIATQNYFANAQRDQLHVQVENLAAQIGHYYRANGEDWNEVPLQYIQTSDPYLLIITDQNEEPLLQRGPASLTVSANDQSTLTQALRLALQGQETDGHLQGSNDSNSFTGYFVAETLHYNGQENGQIIGAMVAALPERYLQGSPPLEFLANVNQAILVTSVIVALAVILFSLLLARSLTRPLESLTVAADQMRRGDYTTRTNPPKSRDELERLAVTFNAMADTIESDVNELRRQEQLRRDLLANIAHDLATPLTAIQGFSEALADGVIVDEEARQETAQLIGREVQRLRRLVSDVRDMTSLDSGRARLELAPLDLQALVDETLAVIGPECEQGGITLRNEIDPQTAPVLADSDRITQVLLNLLDNARRHTPEGGGITVSAHPLGKMLRVCVSDSGTGIDAADLPYIFERFYRVDRARTASAGGSGLGLSIVKAIITAHGGTISAESSAGQGTRIYFSLPLVTSGVPSIQSTGSL
jgi:two-component system, OmpR family, sensor histidine kinase BaeS